MSSGQVLDQIHGSRSGDVKGGRAWRFEMLIATAAALAIISVFVATSSNPAWRYLYTSSSSAIRILAAICILRGLWCYRPEYRLIWLLLLARCAWSAIFIPLRNAFIADPLWWVVDALVGTSIYILAAIVLVHMRSTAHGRSLWIDILAICVSVAFVLLAYFGNAVLSRLGVSWVTIVTGIVLPSFDVILIAMTLLLVFTWRDRNVSLGLLLASFVLVPLADLSIQLAQLEVFSMSLLHTWSPFSLVSVALLGVAALHPSMRMVEAPVSHDPEAWDRPRAVLIIVAFLLALSGLLIEPESGKVLPPALVVGVLGIMFLLIAWRAHLATRSLIASRERIHYLATHDDATGLPNFLGLAETHNQILLQAQGGHALLLLRLSQLHEVGQLWGLAIRDAWIARVATTLSTTTANIGQLARVGTDQFALLANNLEPDALGLDMIARRMAASVRSMRSFADQAGNPMHIVSAFDIGIASAHDGAPLHALLRDAESAIAVAHTQGENRIAHYDESVAAAEHRRLALLTRLRGATWRNEFALHYQPVVDMATRAVVFHEALLRWQTVELGDIPPAEFIPLAESIDEIEHITDWVMNTACAALVSAEGSRIAMPGYRMSINISAHSLRRPGLARRMMTALARHRLHTTDICLELTERTQMEDPHGELSMLRARGFALAIDDFGSGYSNLSMLARITADTIKLDASFVRAIEADASMRDLCISLLAQVSKQGAKVVAEGIETQAQHDLLLSLGCHYGQGWLYGRPSPHFASAHPLLEVG